MEQNSGKSGFSENILKRRSIIFLPDITNPSLEYSLIAVNPHFCVVRNLKLSIPNKFWFEGACRVYDPYNNEERFLRTIENFVRVCGIDRYFYIDDDGIIWKTDTTTDTKTVINGMQIIDDEAEKVGHIMPVTLGSVLNACPELKPIVDIGCESDRKK